MTVVVETARSGRAVRPGRTPAWQAARSRKTGPDIRIFVNREPIRKLETALVPADEVQILQVLRGG